MAKRKPKAPPADTPLGEAPADQVAEHLPDPVADNPVREIVEKLAASTGVEEPGFAAREQARRHGEPQNSVAREQALRNPAPENDIALTADDRDGPHMRLFRERHPSGHIAAIQFSDKPSDEIRQKLRDAGWQWKQQDGVWKKPLGEQPGLAHYHNQKLFEEIANEIRAGNGLEPVLALGNGRS